MAVVIDDLFTVGINTDLVDHAPTDAGTGYTEIENTGATRKAFIPATTDRVELDGDDNNNRILYTAQGTYTSNEYDVEIEIRADGVADDLFWLLGRVTDTSNYYAAGIEDAAGTDVWLVKKVGGTVTDLDSADTDFNGGTWGVTSLKFEIRDGTKKIFGDDSGGKDSYTELASTTDDALTSVGEAGIAYGNIRLSTDDVDNGWKVDGLLVTEVVGGPDTSDQEFPLMPGQHQPIIEPYEVIGY